MKQYASLIILVGFLLMHPGLSCAVDYSGQWHGTITESVTNCKNLGKAEPGDYKLTIIHKANDIVIMENVMQRPYTGVFNPQQPNNIHVLGTYIDDGGYVTEQVNIEFDSDTEGKGQSIWRWSDGYFACGGRFTFTMVKIRP